MERNAYDETVKMAIDAWSGKLMDLSARNRLIRFANGDYAANLIAPTMVELYDLVQEGKPLTFNRPLRENDDKATYATVTLMRCLGFDLPVTVGDIYLGREGDPKPILAKIGKKADEALEERGINMLYLCFGFVKWNEAGKKAERNAPLILVPVTLTENAQRRDFTLSRREDDPVLNATLQYFFKKEKSREIPEPTERDLESGEALQRYLEEVRTKLEGLAEVKEGVGIGILGDTKISSYRDLVENRNRIAKHPFIRAILGDPAVDLPPIPSDTEASSRLVNTVHSADGSQYNAVAAAKAGCSFVLDGPPGTGKSQTIANIIAALIAEGKKVLFVSQKYAALDVVMKRMEEAGLREFCLALYSYKSGKKGILKNIVEAMEATGEPLSADEERLLSDFFAKEEALGAYIDALHRTLQPLGKSVYDIFCELQRIEETDLLGHFIEDPLSVSAETYYQRLNALEAYQLAAAKAKGKIDPTIWRGYDLTEGSLTTVATLGRLLERTEEALSRFLYNLGQLGLAEEGKTACLSALKGILDELGARLDPLPLPAKLMADKAGLEKVLAIVEALAEDLVALSGMSADEEALFHKTVEGLDLTELLDREGTAMKALAGYDLVACKGMSVGEREEYLFANRKVLTQRLVALCQLISGIASVFRELEDTLGLGLAPTESALSQYELALRPLLDGYMFHQSYSPDKLPVYRQHHQRLVGLEEEKRALQTKILARWSADAMKMDDPLGTLTRFERDPFTRGNITRVWRRHYRGIFTNEAMRQLLHDLVSVRQLEEEITAIKGLLAEGAGKPAATVLPKWEELTEAYNLFQQLVKDGVMTPAYRALLATGLSEKKKTELISGLHHAKRALDELKPLAAELLATPLTETTSYDKLERYSTEFLRRMQTLSTLWEGVTPHLQRTDLPLALLRRRIGSYALRAKLALSVEKRKKNLRAILGKSFDEKDPDCRGLLVSLRLALTGKTNGYTPRERAHLQPLLAEAKEQYRDACRLTEELSGYLSGEALPSVLLPALLERVRAMQATMDNLSYLVASAKAEATCKSLGLSAFMEAYQAKAEKEEGVKGSLAAVYRYSFLHECCRAARDRDPALLFSRETQESLLADYGSLDETRLTLAKKKARADVISHFTPQIFTKLKGQNNKPKKELPSLRRILFDSARALLQVKPCILMSPISVSYYFKEARNRRKDAFHFDAVIFDEASQIYLEDAIGAIYRADQVIIAGDINQLPPTAFFKGTSGDVREENDGELADEENPKSAVDLFAHLGISPNASLLDVCSDSVKIPQITLLWHYRSCYEELIAPSNHMIYKNLITFPTSGRGEADTGIESVYVEGGHSVKPHGNAVINPREAEKVLELVKEHVARYPTAADRRSLGVIAFGQPQQEYIRELINEYRNNEYKPVDGYDFFADTHTEPFFVKNLENVQGDERDTVIISLCHGKDSTGKIRNTFGPVGMDGGERRLNVAVTRARINVKLVHSVHYHEIGMLAKGGESEATGLRMIRSYIRYAEMGVQNLSGADADGGRDGFVSAVASFLREKGYGVMEGYGCSDNKLDLVVRDPHDSRRMLAAILTDGYSAKRVNGVRDREYLLTSQLTRRGRDWKVYRLWSSAWMQNPESEKAALLAYLEGLVKASDGSVSPLSACEHYGFRPYKRTAFTDTPTADSTRKGDKDAAALSHILHTEAPIHMDLVYERMAEYLGEPTVTDGVKGVVELLLHGRFASRVDRVANFLYWKDGKVIPRHPESPTLRRAPVHIPPEEWQQGVLYLLAVKPLSAEALYTALADSFGFLAGERGVRDAMDKALLCLFLQGRIRMEQGRLFTVTHNKL